MDAQDRRPGHLRRLLRYRPSAEPSLAAPYCVRSAGHYVLAGGWEERRPARGFAQLWWMASGECRFEADGKWSPLSASDVFLYGPDEEHALSAGPDGSDFYFVTFDGLDPIGALAMAGLGCGRLPAGACPSSLFSELLEGIEAPGPEAERKCSATAYEILLEIAFRGNEEGKSKDSGEAVFQALQRHFADPGFGVAQLESLLQIHRSTLFRHCRRRYGRSPTDLLNQLRIERGAALLRDTSLPITEVALLSGFADANYFSKAIRRRLGRSPTELREGGGHIEY